MAVSLASSTCQTVKMPGNTFSHLLKVVDEEAILTQNQGIVSVLGSDSTQTKAAGSTTASYLRRTFSADMSPSKMLSQTCFSFGIPSTFTPMEPVIAVQDAVNNQDQERPGHEDVWRMIQSQKKKVDEKPGGGEGVHVWGSMLTQKDKDDGSKSSSEPYVPSVMKRSTSCPLNKKSLEICTESLGSETGSDVFSSRPPSESGDTEEQNDVKEAQTETQGNDLKKEEVDHVVPRCNIFSTNKKSSTRSFPPPLPSLPRPDSPSRLMTPLRENGRLVLQAVPIPSHSCFHAARQDGRLLLTFADESNHEQVDDNKEEQLFENFELEEDYQAFGDETDEKETEEEEDDQEVADDEEIVMDQVSEKYTSDVTNVHRSIIVMNKLMSVDNRNAKWNTTQNCNTSVNYKGVKPAEKEVEIDHPIPQSLPPVARLIPSPLATAATSFNAYDYFWRAKSTASSTNIKDYPVFKKNNKVQLSHNVREDNRADYSLPLFKGCKEEPRRSHLAREPRCIATS